MKTKYLSLIVCGLFAMTDVSHAVAPYSGVYKGRAGKPIIASLTAAGHIMLVIATIATFRDMINPQKSRVKDNGSFRGASGNGTKIAGEITDFRVMRGTVKKGGKTTRLKAVKRLD